MALILPSYATVLRAFAVLANAAPSNTDLSIHKAYLDEAGYDGYVAALNDIFAGVSDADMAALLLKNTGLDTIDLEGDGDNDNTEIANVFISANAGNRVGAMLDLVKVLQGSTLAPAAAFNANFDAAYNYAINAQNTTWRAFDGSVEQVLTVGMDKLVGGAMNDYFKAYLVGNTTTLQNGDVLDGGAGEDTLYADINPTGVVISAETKGIENVLFRVQADQHDSGDNNIAGVGIIDAERMKDVLNWENNNSRADLVIEDIRINDDQITKDITITMRETDPGDVDYAVYFDQNSLRNTSENASQMNLRVLDTYAVSQGLAALKDSPYGSFTFYVSINGATATKITLASDAMQDAQTLEEMVAAMQAAADAELGAGAVTVSLGSSYTVPDSVSKTDVTGNEIVIAAKSSANIVFNTDGAGSGWLATETVPAVSGLYTSFSTGGTVDTELVTSTVVLDYVGRGSMGGDLVIGGLSVGDTSDSKGVEQFDITVEDDSELQTIQSTHNTLRVVNIVNGEQDRVKDAYNPYDTEGGKLVVTGAVAIAAGAAAGLPGTVGSAFAITGATHVEDYGFTDVMTINASAMTGKFQMTAQITDDSIAKYLELDDTGNNPAADNVDFVYTGGSNNDSMAVTIDGDAAVSGNANNTNTAREDFSFTLNGGAGNDALTVYIDNAAASSNWYTDQALLDNISVIGGAGNDTIWTPGSGDVIIDAGSGDDTVYTDNTGTKATWLINSTDEDPNDMLGDANTPHFLYEGKLTVTYSGGSNGGVTAEDAAALANGFEVKVDIPTGDHYAVTQLHINQAIKKAINDDPVLSKFLSAVDGPANTLKIVSLVDGYMDANDLLITVSSTDITTITNASTKTQVVSEYKEFVGDSEATEAQAQAANLASTTGFNAVEGMDVNQVLVGDSELTFGVAVTTQGVDAVAEVQSIDLTSLVLNFDAVNGGDTLSLGGTVIYTATADGEGAAVAGAALDGTSVVIGGVTWNLSFAGTTLTLTQASAAAPVGALAATVANVSGDGAAALTPAAATVGTAGVAEVAEVFTVTVGGTAQLGETVTFDGLTTAPAAAGDTGTVVAGFLQTVIDADLDWNAAVVGNVVTITAATAGAMTDATAADFTSSYQGAGSNSTATTDNVIDLGAGLDVLALSSSSFANETIVFSAASGVDSHILNFEDGTVNANSLDHLDFTAYLTSKISTSGSVVSQNRIATSTDGNATAEANEVIVLTPTFTTTDTFANLTGDKLKTVLNDGATTYAGMNDGTLDADTSWTSSGAGSLVGGIGKSIVLVENSGNAGEYKVFELTFDGTSTNTKADFSNVTLIGTVDFGDSIDVTTATLLV